jgi:hypothetical protein
VTRPSRCVGPLLERLDANSDRLNRSLEQTDHGARFQARSTSGVGSGSANTAGSVGARSVMTSEGLTLVGQ